MLQLTKQASTCSLSDQHQTVSLNLHSILVALKNLTASVCADSLCLHPSLLSPLWVMSHSPQSPFWTPSQSAEESTPSPDPPDSENRCRKPAPPLPMSCGCWTQRADCTTYAAPAGAPEGLEGGRREGSRGDGERSSGWRTEGTRGRWG